MRVFKTALISFDSLFTKQVCYYFKFEEILLGTKCSNVNISILSFLFQLAAEKAELEETLAKGDNVVKEMEVKVKKLETEKKDLDRQVSTKHLKTHTQTHTFYLGLKEQQQLM